MQWHVNRDNRSVIYLFYLFVPYMMIKINAMK